MINNISIENITPKKAKEIFNEFSGREYVNSISCTSNWGYNSSVNIEANSTAIFADLVRYFS